MVSNNDFILSAILLGAGASTGFQGFTTISASNIALTDVLYEKLELAETRLDNLVRNFGNRIGLLQARENFLNEYTTGLIIGAEKISLADLNEEAANSSALELKHEIGLTTITNANRTQQLLLQIVSGR